MEEAATRRKKRREVLAAAIGLVAVVMLWRAIWDITEALMTPLMSLIVGLILIAVVGYLSKDYLKELI